MKLTSCCNAYSTYHNDELICKVCYKNVPCGEGDGDGAAMIITKKREESK